MHVQESCVTTGMATCGGMHGHTPAARHKDTHGAVARCSAPFHPSSRPVPPCPGPGWQCQGAELSMAVVPPGPPHPRLRSGGHMQRQVLLSACGGVQPCRSKRVLRHSHYTVQHAYALTAREGVLNSSCRALSEHSGNTVGTIVMSS